MAETLILTEKETASYSLLSGEFNSGKSNASTLFSELYGSHADKVNYKQLLF